MKRIITTILYCSLVNLIAFFLYSTVDGQIKMDLALTAVNGTMADSSSFQAYRHSSNLIWLSALFINFVIIVNALKAWYKSKFH